LFVKNECDSGIDEKIQSLDSNTPYEEIVPVV